MTAPKTPPRTPSRTTSRLSARNLVEATASPEHVPEPGTPRNMYQAKQKKKFTVKGFITGESRKDRRAREEKEAKEKGTSSSSRSVPGDEPEAETVYQVDVDDRTISVMSSESKTTPSATTADKAAEGFLSGGNKAYMLKVVLLLMDPETRRFELLQLEFDSDKALVSDVLTQIPVAVTEEVLKKQTYIGICGSAGSEMNSAILLSEFCKGNDVLVAVPEGVAATECARLARPILNDEKVINMLKASGIDASAWKEIKQPAPTTTTRALPAEPTKKSEPTKEAEGGGGVFMVVFMIIVAIILQVYHSKITAPIEPGQVLSPGGWVSRCGLASIFPICENSYLEMGDDGILTLTDANGELEWQMEGSVCKSDIGCTNGLEMRADDKLAIGGKVVNWVNVKQSADPISPWPFAEQPKLKIIHARK